MDSNEILNKVKRHTPSILGHEAFSKFAVLLPLVHVNNEVNILFEVRSHNLRRQPGEICFPGGRIDKRDRTERDAALRETIEELGIQLNDVSDVYPIDYLVSPFGMMVYPYVGIINSPEKIKPNPSEVEEVFSVPLQFFIKTKPQIHRVNIIVEPDENFPYNLIVGGENYNWRKSHIEEYFYIYKDKVIWGLTAKILSHFVEIVR